MKDIKLIPLSEIEEALGIKIDYSIPEKVEDGCLNKEGYKMIRINGYRIAEHKAIWEAHYGKVPKGCLIHHKNGIKDDNRIDNLELMTFIQHMDWHKKNKTKSSQQNLKLTVIKTFNY